MLLNPKSCIQDTESQGQGHKMVSTDVIWKCLGQPIYLSIIHTVVAHINSYSDGNVCPLYIYVQRDWQAEKPKTIYYWHLTESNCRLFEVRAIAYTLASVQEWNEDGYWLAHTRILLHPGQLFFTVGQAAAPYSLIPQTLTMDSSKFRVRQVHDVISAWAGLNNLPLQELSFVHVS